MKISKLTQAIEQHAPVIYKEGYDNPGLLVGNNNAEVSGVLISVDVTEEVVDEAIANSCNVIVAHHPVIFKGLTKLNGESYNERAIIKAIKNDVAIYAAHTNLDKVTGGINSKLCEKIGLKNCRILAPEQGWLKKLVVFIPEEYADHVREAIFNAGAGYIGEYDKCSYNLEGQGTFRPSENTDPFSGEIGKLQFEPEVRVETVFPAYRQNQVITRMIEAHPYEEPAYDIYPIENTYEHVGFGMIGETEKPLKPGNFLRQVKDNLKAGCIKHTTTTHHSLVQKVAVCGGSGSFLINNAIAAGADVFITADLKYHQFFDANGKIILADVGHYESEQVALEIFYEIIQKNFSNLAAYLSKINTNPVNYM